MRLIAGIIPELINKYKGARMWRRIRGWLQRQWALKTNRERNEIRIKAGASFAAFCIFLYGSWSVFEVEELTKQLANYYWPLLRDRVREDWLELVSLLLTVIVSIYSGVLALRQTMSRALSWESETFKSSLKLIIDPIYVASGYKISSAEPILNRFLYSKEVNKELMLADELAFELRKGTWTLNSIGSELVSFAVTEASRRGALIFDDPKIRLCSDLILKNGKLPRITTLQRTTYFNGLATNDLSFTSVKKRREEWNPDNSPFEREIYDGMCLFATADNASKTYSLKRLIDSSCSNHIGVSTLAITMDGSLIITGQSANNAQNRNLWAPSGSGSADWKDVDNALDFPSLVCRCAERELIEECGLSQDIRFNTVLLGFARDLKRGGKPDFFCVTFLPLRSGDLRLKHKDEEKVFTAYNVYDSISPISHKIDFRPSHIVESVSRFRNEFADRMSGQMAMSLDLLVQAVGMPSPPVISGLENLDLGQQWQDSVLLDQNRAEDILVT